MSAGRVDSLNSIGDIVSGRTVRARQFVALPGAASGKSSGAGAFINAGGTIGFARVIVSTLPAAPPFDIAGLSVTVTLIASRRYRISAQTLITSSVATDAVQLAIIEGGTDVMLTNEVSPPAGGVSGSNRASVIRLCPTDVAAGPRTYKLAARRNGGGTGNFTNNAGATFPSYILVEDIGT